MKIPLFDIDGTLVPAGSKINIDAFKFAVKKVYGVDADMYEIKPEGMVDRQILVEVLKLHGFTEEQVKEKIEEENNVIEDFASQHKGEINLQPLPGVLDLLKDLGQLNAHLGILSGNVEGLAWAKLENAGIKEFFKFGAFGSETYRRVELVEIARVRAEKMLDRVVQKNELVLVGDTPRDVECARDTGTSCIIVSTGFYSYEDLKKENPDLLVGSLEEKDKILKFLNN